jgi:predicted MFS family arabinose efflux permease
MTINRWVILAVVFIGRTSFGFQFQSVGSVSGLMREDLVISHAQIGTLIGIYMLPGVFFALPGGFLVKRFGDKRLLLIGLAMMATGGVVVGVFDSYDGALVGRILSGSGSVVLTVVATKMVVDWFAGKETRTGLGIMLAAWPFGIALGLASQGWIGETFSWQAVMYVTAGISIVALVGAAILVKPAEVAIENPSGRLFSLSKRELILASLGGLAWALFNAGFSIHVSFTPDVLTNAGRTAIEAGAIVSIGIWVTMVATPVGGYIVDKTGRPYLFLLIVMIGLTLTVGAFPYLAIPLVLSVLFGLFTGPGAAPIVALPSEVLRPDNRGPGLGVFFTWYYFAMAVGPPFAGAGRDWTGSSSTPLLIAAGMYVAIIVVILAFRSYAGKPGRVQVENGA